MRILIMAVLMLMAVIFSGCQSVRQFFSEKFPVFVLTKKTETEPFCNMSFVLSEKEEKDLSEKALKGDAEAALKLSQYHTLWPPDSEKEIYWLRVAANNGDKYALLSLASILEHSSKEEYYKEIVHLYKKAAELRIDHALLPLAEIYFKGKIVPKDLHQAKEWYKKAAESGNNEAQFSLAQIYETGTPSPKDLYKAKFWYEKAAFSNVFPAILKMIDIYFEGIGCEKDAVTAYSWVLLAESKFHQKNPSSENITGEKIIISNQLFKYEIEIANEKFKELQQRIKQ